MLKRFVPLVMLAGLVFLVAAACSSDPEPTATPARSSPPTIPPAPAATTATATPLPSSDSGGQTGTAFAVSLQDPGGSGAYLFDPSELTFSVGETVTFTLSSETEFHTFTVTDDSIDIDVDVDGGATQTVSFTFDQAGTFELI